MKAQDVADRLFVRDLLELVDAVCKVRRVTRAEVCGRGRTKAVALARREVWWRMRHHPEMRYSYPEIGRLFGRDHTTVMSGVRAHERENGTTLKKIHEHEAEWRVKSPDE